MLNTITQCKNKLKPGPSCIYVQYYVWHTLPSKSYRRWTPMCLLCLTGIRNFICNYTNDLKSDNTILTRQANTSKATKMHSSNCRIPHHTGTVLHFTVPYPNTVTKVDNQKSKQDANCIWSYFYPCCCPITAEETRRLFPSPSYGPSLP